MRTHGAVLLCAVLASAATVCTAAPAKVQLPRCRVVGAAVGGADAFPKAVEVDGGVGGVAGMGCGAMPVGTRVAGVCSVPGNGAGVLLAAPAVTGLVSGVRVSSIGPGWMGLVATRKQRWDLLQDQVAVWRWSVLGELGVRANQVTDDAEYQRLTAEYWKALEAAIERRRVLGGRREWVKEVTGE